MNVSDVTLSDLVEDLCAKSNEFAAKNFEYYKACRHAHGKALIQGISLLGQGESDIRLRTEACRDERKEIAFLVLSDFFLNDRQDLLDMFGSRVPFLDFNFVGSQRLVSFLKIWGSKTSYLLCSITLSWKRVEKGFQYLPCTNP